MPRTYATDQLAREVAGRAIDRGADGADRPGAAGISLHALHAFGALPTSSAASRCSRKSGNADNLKYARDHADIVSRFGRFPHRNQLLGRQTTAEEQAFLDGGGFRADDATVKSGHCRFRRA